MIRDLASMSAVEHDLVIIGGGISGAAIAHEAALRGLSVALLEKSDFGGGTSAATSKLIHGGLRYLKMYDFALVRESLRERRIMEFIAPHIVAPVPFLLPTYRGRSNGLAAIVSAMLIYNVLSYDKNRLDDPDRRLPGWRPMSPRRALEMEPGLHKAGMTGAVLYFDCQMWAPERLTLEFLLAADANGAMLANYARVDELIVEKRRVRGARVTDLETGRAHEITGRVTINAAGPWADLIDRYAGDDKGLDLVRSQGIHLVTKRLSGKQGLVLSTKSGRLFFVIPWRDRSLIGTTDSVFAGDPDAYRVTPEKVAEFIGEVNEALPNARLTTDDIDWTYGGLRPIVETETAVMNVNRASRKYEITDHETAGGVAGFVTVIGGKYTTSRGLAETVVELAAQRLGRPRPARVSAGFVLPGGRIGSWRGFVARLMREFGLSEGEAEKWTRTYGAHAPGLMAAARRDATLAEPLAAGEIETAANVDRAVRLEMARTLADVVFRRTGLGTTGAIDKAGAHRIASLMGERLAWDAERRENEVNGVIDRIRRKNIFALEKPAAAPAPTPAEASTIG
ncbi:glycerol-3-phosphate dehydrogenase/oxidase [bacterium]|nr:glycerol-3-phosphate dehydrogenase/oxidase [bacterium]